MKRKNKSAWDLHTFIRLLSPPFGGAFRGVLSKDLYTSRDASFMFFFVSIVVFNRAGSSSSFFPLFCCFGQFYMRRSLHVRDQRRSRGKDASSSSDDDDDEARGNWARSRFLVRLLPPG